MLHLNPPLVVRLVKCPLLGTKYTLPSVRYVFCGSAPMQQYLERELIRKLNVRFITHGTTINNGSTSSFTMFLLSSMSHAE